MPRYILKAVIFRLEVQMQNRNRKGYFSNNVQAICDVDLKVLHIISRWPESVHGSTIFNNSPLPSASECGDMVMGIYWAMVDIHASSTSSLLFHIYTMQTKCPYQVKKQN
nr:PREDICTED: uncharacterized protein LOC107398695 [Tribolium castaneum]|eukprot:XP_015839283.1 PREDICTED: uncharacterized protein LOC107398695 [Tribolium castaneum]